MRLGDYLAAHFDDLRSGCACVIRVEVREPDRLALAQLDIARPFAYSDNVAVFIYGQVVEISAAHVDGFVLPTDDFRVPAQRSIRIRRCQVKPDGVANGLQHVRLSHVRSPRAVRAIVIRRIIGLTPASCRADTLPVPSVAPLPPADALALCRMSNPSVSLRSDA